VRAVLISVLKKNDDYRKMTSWKMTTKKRKIYIYIDVIDVIDIFI